MTPFGIKIRYYGPRETEYEIEVQNRKEGRLFTQSIVDLRVRIWCEADSKLHRQSGPALEYSNGNKYWFKHGREPIVKAPMERPPSFADGFSLFWSEGGMQLFEGVTHFRI